MPADQVHITPLIGHRLAQRRIQDAFAKDKLHHSLLLHGPAGIGKSKLGLFIASWLVSNKSQTPSMFESETSNVQSICDVDRKDAEARLVFSHTHPDVLMISSKEGEDNKSGQIKTDALRKIKHFLAQTPARGKWRVVIVDSLDKINLNGANAMLKTLEEPPENSLIILLSSKISAVLPTILSRCNLIKLEPLEEDETQQIIHHIWPDGDEALLSQLSILCEGAPGRAEMLQLSGGLGLFEQSCMMIAHPEFSMKECRVVADKWGAGGASQQARKQSALYLFGHLLSKAAETAATGIEPQEGFASLDFVKDAVKALGARHSAQKLAELHQHFTSKMQKADRLYVDTAPILVQFFQEIHSQRPVN